MKITRKVLVEKDCFFTFSKYNSPYDIVDDLLWNNTHKLLRNHTADKQSEFYTYIADIISRILNSNIYIIINKKNSVRTLYYSSYTQILFDNKCEFLMPVYSDKIVVDGTYNDLKSLIEIMWDNQKQLSTYEYTMKFLIRHI